MEEFPRKGNNKQKAAWHDAFVERTRGPSFAGDEPQRAALIRHHTSESQKYKRAYAKEVALHALKSQNADAHLAAAEAYRATGDRREQAHLELAKDPKKQGGYLPYASKRHEMAEASRLGLTASTAQKSEPRATTLARGILAAVELRKSLQKTDEHAQQPGESFGAYAHRHAKRWAQERTGLAEPEADAYAQHFVSTYPEGLDESGNSIDHPVAYRSWQEQSAPRASQPAPASAPPRQKPPRKKPAAVPSGKIAWMHGQRPK